MKNNIKKYVSIAAAAAVVVGGVAFGASQFAPEAQPEIASIVSFDVNPSIELRLGADSKVIEVVAQNADAEAIIKGMDLKGADMNTAANALIGSLLQNGYIDEVANSILISVEDTDEARGKELQEKLSTEINTILQASAVNASILAQFIDDEITEVDEIANFYNMSTGKATLINEIMTANPTLEIEDLVELSVNELNLVASNPKNTPENVTSTGTPSASEFISEEDAIAAALAAAGITTTDLIGEIEVEFDMENGVIVYEVEFDTATGELDFNINAENAEVVIELDDDNDDMDDDNDDDNDDAIASTPSDIPAENDDDNDDLDDDNDDLDDDFDDIDDNDNDMDDLDDDFDDIDDNDDDMDDLDDDFDDIDDIDDDMDDLDDDFDDIDDIDDDMDDLDDDFDDIDDIDDDMDDLDDDFDDIDDIDEDDDNDDDDNDDDDDDSDDDNDDDDDDDDDDDNDDDR